MIRKFEGVDIRLLAVVAAAGCIALTQILKRKLNSENTEVAREHGEAPVANDVTQLIGKTPLVRLNYLSELTQCSIYGKLEFMNPGGSAKDRIALAIVEYAEKTGKLRPGFKDRVFEGTSGSTGISLALVCCAKGYEAHIVIPDDTSNDKVRLLEMYGAKVHKVRPAGIADAGHYVNVARRLAEEVNLEKDSEAQAIFANQFEEEQNWLCHYKSTGPEIYAQMPNVDCFITGAGTGGTISGCGVYLTEQNKNIKIVLADVPGSGLYNKVHFGVMFNNVEKEGTRRRHQVDTMVEGIGLNRLTRNLQPALTCVSDAERVEDVDSRYMASLLVHKEGLFVGSSSAVNCVAAVRQAKKLGPGHTLVTILCDSGTRHLSKFYAMPPDSECPIAKELVN